MAPKAQALSGSQKRYLRSLAHSLDPVVQIGKSGLTKGVLSQIDEALLRHELIKVKLGKEAPVELSDVASSVEGELAATIAQTIGHTLVLYRRHPDKPRISIPKKGAKKNETAKVGAKKTSAAKSPAPAKNQGSSWLTETGNDDDSDGFDDDE